MKKRFEFDSKIHASKGYFNVVGVVGNMEKEVKAHRQSPYNEDIRENNYTIEILTSEADKIDVKLKYKISDSVKLIGVHKDDVGRSKAQYTVYSAESSRKTYERDFQDLLIGDKNLLGIDDYVYYSKELNIIVNEYENGETYQSSMSVTADVGRQILLGTGVGNQSKISDGLLQEGQLVRVEGRLTPYKFVTDNHRIIDGYSYVLTKIEILDTGTDNKVDAIAKVRELDIKRAEYLKEKVETLDISEYNKFERLENNYKHTLADFTVDIVYSSIKYENGRYYIYGTYVNFKQDVTHVRLEVANEMNSYNIEPYLLEDTDRMVKHMVNSKNKFKQRKITVSGILININKEQQKDTLKTFTPYSKPTKKNMFMEALNLTSNREEIIEEVSAVKNINRKTTNHLVVTAIWYEKDVNAYNRMDVFPQKFKYVKEQKFNEMLMERKEKYLQAKAENKKTEFKTLKEYVQSQNTNNVPQDKVVETKKVDKKPFEKETENKILTIFMKHEAIALTKVNIEHDHKGTNKIIDNETISTLMKF